MTAPVVHVGPQSAEQVGYDLRWEFDLGRVDDWRLNGRVVLRPEALAAEERPRGTGGGR